MLKHVIVVRGRSILQAPLLVTSEAAAVEIYDGENELVAVLHPVLEDNYWAVTTKTDPDWEQCLSQLGYMKTLAEFDPARKKSFFDG